MLLMHLRVRLALACLVLCLLVLILSQPAFAQAAEPAATTWTQLAVIVVGGIVSIAVTVITAYVRLKFNVDIDKGLRDGFQTAVTNQAGALIARLGLDQALQLRTGHRELDSAVNTVLAGVPDAVRRFNIKPDDVANRILAKLGLIVAAAATPATPVSAIGGQGA